MFFYAPPEPIEATPEVVVVTASSVSRNKDAINQGVVIITREHALLHSMGGGIGETLQGHAGIRSSFFGPNASRPIIRGLGEDRIRLLSNSLVGIDASTVSPDHSPAVDGLSAQQIEVLKGAAALRYGSNAVGGVVNVIDGRLPTTLPSKPLNAEIFAGLSSVNDGKVASGNVSYNVGNFVFRLDALTRQTEAYKIPGYTDTERERAISGNETRGKVPNSYGDLNEYGAGVGYIGDKAHIAIAYKTTDSNYGVPNEGAHIELEQSRYDLQGGFKFDGFISELNYAASYGDYEHSEIEDGVIATTFKSKGYDSRIEARHKKIADWEGVWGVEYADKDFSAVSPIGEAAYILPVTIKNSGVFGIERYENDVWGTEFGARFENHKYSGEAGNRDFDGTSYSASAFVKPLKGLRFALTYAKTDRIPTEVELFANGGHDATQTYDEGDPNLKKETAKSFELAMNYRHENGNLEINFWNAHFDDFINFVPTDRVEDDLPVYVITQKDADLRGFEIQLSQNLGELGGHFFKGDIGIDYVRGRYEDGNVAKIPPMSAIIGLEMSKSYLSTRLEFEHIAKQDKLAEFETPTNGANVVNLSATISPPQFDDKLQITLKGDNLTDEDVREHTSSLKEFLPRPGRNISLSLHYRY
jgi:iron complex outermembrane receptor protein